MPRLYDERMRMEEEATKQQAFNNNTTNMIINIDLNDLNDMAREKALRMAQAKINKAFGYYLTINEYKNEPITMNSIRPRSEVLEQELIDKLKEKVMDACREEICEMMICAPIGKGYEKAKEHFESMI